MDIKLKLLMLLGTIYITTAGVSCHKICLESSPKYSFEIGIKAVPDKDTIHIGDTIWLILNAPVKLLDQKTGQMINYEGAANLGTAISFQKLNSDSTFSINAANKFNFYLSKGEETKNANPKLYREYLFLERSDRYLFKLGIISQEKGVFGIIISNASNVFRKKDKCTKAGFIINFEDTDRHYKLFPHFAGGSIPDGGDYYFVVK